VVGEMSRIGRGMHTTRSVTLVPLPGGGAIADTPGFGLPTLDAVSSRQLGELFPEFAAAGEAAAGRCRFDDCLHVAEPGCVVRGAGLERHPYYLKFLAEVKVRAGGQGAPGKGM
jgi:ribosome biogenesis GTPase